ncbi:hypothetical protein MMC09_005541 [Bachmanniomyces sp. S44760]|nr:hypothetical protein [Bachmanniomyces sp. S44760]
MDLVAGVRKEGSRGGRDAFKWDDVKDSQHRENYLGHSLMAPVGRWQKNKDLSWYAKGDDSAEAQAAAAARAEEIRKIKEAERDALSAALGFAVEPRMKDSQIAGAKEVEKAIKETGEGDEEGGKGVGFGGYLGAGKEDKDTIETQIGSTGERGGLDGGRVKVDKRRRRDIRSHTDDIDRDHGLEMNVREDMAGRGVMNGINIRINPGAVMGVESREMSIVILGHTKSVAFHQTAITEGITSLERTSTDTDERDGSSNAARMSPLPVLDHASLTQYISGDHGVLEGQTDLVSLYVVQQTWHILKSQKNTQPKYAANRPTTDQDPRIRRKVPQSKFLPELASQLSFPHRLEPSPSHWNFARQVLRKYSSSQSYGLKYSLYTGHLPRPQPPDHCHVQDKKQKQYRYS